MIFKQFRFPLKILSYLTPLCLSLPRDCSLTSLQSVTFSSARCLQYSPTMLTPARQSYNMRSDDPPLLLSYDPP